MRPSHISLLHSLCFVLISAANAETDPSNTPPTERNDETQESPEKSESIAMRGRVFVGNFLTRQRVSDTVFWGNRLAATSARIGITYKFSRDYTAVVKLEAASGRARLRDAYLRIKPKKRWQIQAGRFKRPISEIALASRWDLPSIDRGLLSNLPLLVSGGRDHGAMVKYKPRLGVKTKLSVSVFQTEDQEELDASEHWPLDVHFRAAVKPRQHLEMASSFAIVGYGADIGGGESYQLGTIASLEFSYVSSRFHWWLEGFTGDSIDNVTSTRFWAFRSLLSPRFELMSSQNVSPFVGVSFFDPDDGLRDDSDAEVQLGVAVGMSKSWRFQAEYSQVFPGRRNSLSIESAAFRLQLAARFKE